MCHPEFLLAEIVLLTVLNRSGLPRTRILPLEPRFTPSKNVTDQQLLTGATDSKPVVIAGESRLPPGTGRFPAVVIVHGSGA
jgi:hypothetical protein